MTEKNASPKAPPRLSRAHSISNAVLARRHHIDLVSFQSPSGSSSSSRNSSEEDLPKLVEPRFGNHAHNDSGLTSHNTSGTASPSFMSPTSSVNSLRRHSLKKLLSHPGERLVLTRSNDMHSDDSSYGYLPAFNKRPLTDTPIVSSMTSPRDDFSDDEEKTGRMRSISHLNLSDMNGLKPESIKLDKPHMERSEGKDKERKGHTVTFQLNSNAPSTLDVANTEGITLTPQKSASVSPNTVPTENIILDHKLAIDSQTKNTLLQDVPLDVQQQFEKTPSLERLKSLLLTKPPPSARKAYTLNIPGQTSSKTSPDGKIASVDVGSKLVIVMVGLPARGKSYITNKLTRYLNWLQHDCRVFNVGNTRRKDKKNAGPEANPLPDTSTPTNEADNEKEKDNGSVTNNEHNADFFRPDNKTSTALREKWAMDTLDQLLDYVINGSGSVGIFDATNSTKLRRLRVLKRIQQRSNGELKVLFLESICSDPNIIEQNIRLKLSGPDYRNMDPEVALKDFVGRLHNYEKAYETIDESEEKINDFQYVKMIDVGKKVVSYNVQGFLASQTIYFLLNFNLCERQIWITRHGESVDNLSGRIGGDSHLTKRGQKFSKTLARFMDYQRQEFRKNQLESFSSRLELKYQSIFNDHDIANIDNIPNEPNFCVWTSMLLRSVETGKYFDESTYSVKEMRMLNELGGGKFEGMTYDEIQQRYPREFDSRLRNKLSYRYPGVGGESYLDVLTRLRPLITEIERTTAHVLIISHRVVLRILLAYFLNLDKSSIGELDVPLHTLYCLESKPYGTDYRMYEYDEGLDWFSRVEPDHQKNMKEVGVVFKERKYSVVPTAPPSRKSDAEKRKRREKKDKKEHHPKRKEDPKSTREEVKRDASFSVRKSLGMSKSSSTNSIMEESSLTQKKVEDLNRMRIPTSKVD